MNSKRKKFLCELTDNELVKLFTHCVNFSYVVTLYLEDYLNDNNKNDCSILEILKATLRNNYDYGGNCYIINNDFLHIYNE